MAERPFQVVVWGSTGFVGRLVCEHLTRHYQGKVRWAMAGRNQAKLKDLRANLAKINPAVKDTAILLGEVGDQASLNKVASQTKVVIATSGPFAKLGTPVVEACVSSGTHYCDITGKNGEVPWVMRTIKRFEGQAAEKGVKICNFCGFDSIPSDLGTLFVTHYLRKKLGRTAASVEGVHYDVAGGVSGGTVASLFGALFDESSAERKQSADPYCLDPPDSKRGPDGRDSFGIHSVPPVGMWGAPFIMAPVNTRVVRRSNAVLGHQYGDKFKYTEVMGMPNMLAAAVATFVSAVGFALVAAWPLTPLWRRVLPKAGEGPSRKTMEQGHWNFVAVAKTEEQTGAKEQTVLADLKGAGDPGYFSTSRMLLEAGLCLALQEDELKQAGLKQGGVLTPASALGLVLIKRLQNLGVVTFKIRNDPSFDL